MFIEYIKATFRFTTEPYKRVDTVLTEPTARMVFTAVLTEDGAGMEVLTEDVEG